MTSIKELQTRAEGWAFGGVRVLAGLMWLANLHWKVPGDFGEDTGRGLYKYAAAAADNAPLAPYRWLSAEVILPNFAAFGWFTLLSETVIAAMLLIGYRTRLAGLAGAMLSVPIMLSVIYYPGADEWSWSYLMMIGLHLLIAASPGCAQKWAVDGVLSSPPSTARGALSWVGGLGIAVGVLGLIVARSVDFAGRSVALLGSDAGFIDGDQIVRRWELKFLWFNPLWALLTVAFGALVIAGIKRAQLAIVGAAGFAAIALVAVIQGTWDYARDDGAMQKIGTGSNVALWAGLAVAAVLIARHGGRSVESENAS